VSVVGVVMVMVGFVVSEVILLTMIVAAVEVARLPATSRATARIVWKPLVAEVVFQLVEYGEVMSSAPRFALSSLNWTPVTPMLSLAVAETVMVLETVVFPAGAVRETAGNVVSRVMTDWVVAETGGDDCGEILAGVAPSTAATV